MQLRTFGCMFRAARLLLLPFSVLYGLIIRLRHVFFDSGWSESETFSIPTICVGNLDLGGAGKTPHTEYLVRLLAPHFKVAILSRGYGRKTKGYIRAGADASARTIGDEPMQYHRKFPAVTVAVAEKRAIGLRMLAQEHDVVILDDAYQHRAVRPGYSILLFDHTTLLRPQFLVPAGNRRDVFSARKRADLLVVTKLPEHPPEAEQKKYTAALRPVSGQQIFFSGIRYGQPVALFPENAVPAPTIDAAGNAVLLSGIANPKPLRETLESRGWRLSCLTFPDHHAFTRSNMEELIRLTQGPGEEKKIVLTTEKDAQRLLDESLRDLLLNLPVYYIPIEVAFYQNGSSGFDQEILDYVNSAARDRRLHQTENREL